MMYVYFQGYFLCSITYAQWVVQVRREMCSSGLILVISYRRFGTTYQPQLEGSRFKIMHIVQVSPHKE